MSKFQDDMGPSQNQIRQRKALENLINQQNKSKSKQTQRTHILVQQLKPQSCMEKLNISQIKSSKMDIDRKIIKNSLLQDIGNIELEIQKMTVEYKTPVNKTQIIDSNNGLFNQKTDVSKSDHKISQIHRHQTSNDNTTKLTKTNLISEASYLKLAESMRNYSNQKKSVEVKIIDKPKTKPYNILSTKQQSDINIQKKQNSDVQNTIKTQIPQDNRLSQKINSERNKTTQIKSILKQTSFHTQDINCIQHNLISNVIQNQQSKVQIKLDNEHNQIQNKFNDDNKLDKALKIYNTLKQLVHKDSQSQTQVREQKN